MDSDDTAQAEIKKPPARRLKAEGVERLQKFVAFERSYGDVKLAAAVGVLLAWHLEDCGKADRGQ